MRHRVDQKNSFHLFYFNMSRLAAGFAAGRNGTQHRGFRIVGEGFLQIAADRIAEFCRDMAGTRKGEQIIPDLAVVSVKLDQEPLLANLAMFGQRTVGETEGSISACSSIR